MYAVIYRQAQAARGNEWTEEVRAHRWSSYKNQFGLLRRTQCVVRPWAGRSCKLEHLGTSEQPTRTQRAAPPCRHDTALIWRINSAGDLTITFLFVEGFGLQEANSARMDGSAPSGEETRALLLLLLLWTWWMEMTCLIRLVANLRSTMIQYNARVAVPLLFSMMLPLHRCYIWAWWSDEALLRLVSPSCKFLLEELLVLRGQELVIDCK